VNKNMTEIPKNYDMNIYCPDCKAILSAANPYTLKYFCEKCNEWKTYGIKIDRER